ncbi:MAG TPA: tyrosine-type recombinase/integrase [Candidatus Hydrogenedentes bacterium]|nr:tyrosine-type recombinase/integrase [Candidatus Hydrogenedentota bacterium]
MRATGKRQKGRRIKPAVDTWLCQLDPKTQAAYWQKLEYFRRWLRVRDVYAAARRFKNEGKGETTRLVEAFKAHLGHPREAGFSPNTINTYLAAIRSMIRALCRYEVIPWTVDVPRVPTVLYRDTRGPGLDAVIAMMQELRRRTDIKGARDFALLRLLFDLASRKGEICQLDMGDVNMSVPQISILRKKRREWEHKQIPEPTAKALEAWLEHRGNEPGPLFWTLKNPKARTRLSGRDVYRIIVRLGEFIGHPVRITPHSLRHTAISLSDTLTGGRTPMMREYAGHSRMDTTMIYHDRCKDMAFECACLVAGSVSFDDLKGI